MTRPHTTISKLSGSALKRIAVITMFGDHFAASVLLLFYYRSAILGLSVLGVSASAWRIIYYCLRGFGRIAFPIFCFLLVEGFCHTSNKLNYAIRLGIFALISEIPFDLALNNYPWLDKTVVLEFSYQNVFFTLFLAFLALWAADAIQKKLLTSRSLSSDRETSGERLSEAQTTSVVTILLKCLIFIIVSLPFAALAEYALFTDYGGFGVLLIVILMCGKIIDSGKMILPKGLPVFEVCLGALAILIWCAAMSITSEFFALFGFLLCLFYNGTKGSGRKWFFYIFYPAHLLALGLLCLVI